MGAGVLIKAAVVSEGGLFADAANGKSFIELSVSLRQAGLRQAGLRQAGLRQAGL